MLKCLSGNFLNCFFLWLLFVFSDRASASSLKVITSTTDLAWAARQIGGQFVKVESLLRGAEDPHFVDARPDFVTKVSRAHVVCVVGLGLEVGWMSRVLEKSGRREIQPGGIGYCETGRRVAVLDKPSGPVDRSMGDVHPLGNPHFWLSPLALGSASAEIKDAFVRVDPANAKFYEQSYAQLVKNLAKIRDTLKMRLRDAGITGDAARILEYHREFAYFADAYDLKIMGSLEEKPGVSPSAGRILQVAEMMKTQNIRLVLAANTASQKLLSKFEELSGVRVIRTGVSIDQSNQISDYELLQTQLIEKLISTHKKQLEKR